MEEDFSGVKLRPSSKLYDITMDPEQCIFIPGFGLAGYRSFGPELQLVGPCKKVNLIAGQNNSGKSNVLRFLQDRHAGWMQAIAGRSLPPIEGLEVHRTSKPFKRAAAFLLPISEAQISKLNEDPNLRQRNAASFVKDVLSSGALSKVADGYWIVVEAEPGANSAQIYQDILGKLILPNGTRSQLYNFALYCLGGASDQESVNLIKLLHWIVSRFLQPPKSCVTIPSIRQPGTDESKGTSFSGNEIVHRLAQLQNPGHHEQEKKDSFRRIQQFLRDVTDRPDAELEVPYERNTITVHMDGRSIPLEGLGTGIHEVIILAAAATSLHQHVVCIEEPEIHLHPLLQKKLLRYLDEQTDNQYFISTHSAHFLDHPGAAIFHVRLTEEGSKVTSATEASERFAICADLGYRASDLLQSNCIIWVEGPSDRIYINEWLRLVEPGLAEGIDYSIMFYGGRLLSHLSPTDPEVGEFISLRKLNRNMVVLMDSDRRPGKMDINATKQRIVDGWTKGEPGFAWVTQGREIENYVPAAAIAGALDAAAPSGKPHASPSNRYQQCIPVVKGKAAADKIKVAHWLVESKKLTLDVLDLRARIEALRQFVHQANHVVTKATQR